MPNQEETKSQVAEDNPPPSPDNTDVSLEQNDQAAEMGGASGSMEAIKAGAKKLVSGGKIVDPELAKRVKGDQKVEGGNNNAETSDSKVAEGDKSTDNETGEEGQELQEPDKVKIGDLEMTEEEWKEAHTALENKSAWQRNYTLKSQAISKYDDDTLEAIRPYLYKQKEVPPNLKDEVLKDMELPKTIEITDDDGDTVVINTEQLPDDFIYKLGMNAFNVVWPELDQKSQEIAEKTKKVENDIAQVQAWQEQQITKEVTGFMKDHQDYAIQIQPGESFKDVMTAILSSGDVHPELPKALKLMNLYQYTQKNGGSFIEAYDAFEGGRDAKKKVSDKIRQNQQDDIKPEKSGEQQKPKSRADKKIDSFRDPSRKEIMEAFG